MEDAGETSAKAALLHLLDARLREVNEDLRDIESRARTLSNPAAELDVLDEKLDGLQECVERLDRVSPEAWPTLKEDAGARFASLISGIIAVKERLETHAGDDD